MAIPINEREKKVEFYYEILANIFFFSQRVQIFPQFFSLSLYWLWDFGIIKPV